MVRVVRGQENKVPVKVTSLIDYSGFSAKLEVNLVEKTVSNLAAKSPIIVLSPSDVASLGNNAFGTFTVYNQSGEVHAVYKIFFKVVDSQSEVQSFGRIRIVIVSSFEYNPGGSGSGSGGGECSCEVPSEIINELKDIEKDIEQINNDLSEKTSVEYSKNESAIVFS